MPPIDKGKISVGVPIDMPFTEVNKIITAQLKGRTFPEDDNGPVAVTVKSAKVEPSGERLLISLLVNAKEKKSWLGLGAEATVHVWGRPVLDPAQQTLKLADIELAVESEAAFGLLGAAARQAMPFMQKALAERATIDLKPFATEAREKIAAAMVGLSQERPGREGRCVGDRRSFGRDRLRQQDAAHRRGGRRLDQRSGDAAAEFLRRHHSQVLLRRRMPQVLSGARSSGSRRIHGVFGCELHAFVVAAVPHCHRIPALTRRVRI